ncbi:hypothetical protein [Streptomyces odontomachi]|uniref:hypothetical protein n=1 Tax=Streptomyces odontomachi TaxID=2944940 RepID=UPI00210F1DC8|nr:hypothetical protein [Streptomyces sp. ODS25]
MHYVLYATHNPEQCPMSNATIKQLLLDIAPEMPNIAQQAGVSIAAGPYVNREHSILTVLDSDSAENVDRFLVDSRLTQWNSVRVIPSLTMEEGLQQLRGQETIF